VSDRTDISPPVDGDGETRPERERPVPSDGRRTHRASDSTRTSPGDDGAVSTAVRWLSSPWVLLVAAVPVALVLGYLLLAWTMPVVCACTPAIPHAQFEFTHDADRGTVTVQHAGGDQFDDGETDRIEIWVDGEVWASIKSALVTGDTVTVPARRGDRVEVVWFETDGGGSQVLAEYTVPD